MPLITKFTRKSLRCRVRLSRELCDGWHLARLASICLIPLVTLACGQTSTGSDAPKAIPVEERIIRIGSDLTPPLIVEGEERTPVGIEDRMEQLKVPGASVAVINDGEIEWARGFGYADIETQRPVTPDTLFQAASISKPVAALASLALVDEGKLELDTPVNEKLVSWKVPDNEYTVKTPVTLRHLLTYTAGLTVPGFPGYGPGEEVPSTVSVLDGEGNTDPVRVVIEPGTMWLYSGGGTTVAQLLVEDVTGKPFDEVMAATVLRPLGMNDSIFQQPLPERLHDRAATGYLADGSPVPGRFRTHPEQAAAGLWTTPSDLARYLIATQQGWRTGDHPVLSGVMVREMLTPGMGNVGLGPAFSEDGERFGSGGSNRGFKCDMTAFLDGDRGAVVMTNSDNGRQLAKDIMLTIATEYGWSGPKPMYKVVAELPEAVLAAIEGVYRGHGRELEIKAGDGRLYVTVTLEGDPERRVLEWLPESKTTFFGSRYGNEVTVSWNDDGTVDGLTFVTYEFEKVE